MRAVVQRVQNCRVEVEGAVCGQIEEGLLVYLGVSGSDGDGDLAYISDKVVNLRIFPDDEGKMNLSVKDTGGAVLVVSQFTLYGDARKGRRPSYSRAAEPAAAESMYRKFLEEVSRRGVAVQEGKFQAMMDVSYTNKGPVTILLDSEKQF